MTVGRVTAKSGSATWTPVAADDTDSNAARMNVMIGLTDKVNSTLANVTHLFEAGRLKPIRSVLTSAYE
jgi:hypothetical protein